MVSESTEAYLFWRWRNGGIVPPARLFSTCNLLNAFVTDDYAACAD